MKLKSIFTILGILLMTYKASSQPVVRDKPLSYDPPGATDTHSKPIEYPHKRIFTFNQGSLQISSDFPGSRLNDLVQLNDSTFSAVIRPENSPINMSPWYAFKIWANFTKPVRIQLIYENAQHRYFPKISTDGRKWQPLDSNSFSPQNTTATLRLNVGADTLWVAAQEVILPSHTYAWIDSLAHLPYISTKVIGHSTLHQPIVSMQISESDNKRVVVVLSRQHPPEVTGYLAMQAFVETIAGTSALARRFRRKFETVVIPLLNPDGVVNGHWRHNAGGVDLNRDWLNFRQPETAAVRDYLIPKISQQQAKVYFAVDFHSTWNDIYYVFDEATIPHRTSIAQKWLAGIEKAIPGYSVNQESYGTDSPTSKNWFFTQFGADAVTYEVGDNTSRDDLRRKGRIAAIELMKVLLKQM